MEIIDEQYDGVLFAELIRKATGIEREFSYVRKRTREDTSKIEELLKKHKQSEVRYFYAEELLGKILVNGSDDIEIRRVNFPEEAYTAVRVAGLYYPQINCIEEIPCNFELGIEKLCQGPVYVKHAVPDKFKWLKLRAFVAYTLTRLGICWEGFPAKQILAEADRKQIIYDDGKDYSLPTPEELQEEIDRIMEWEKDKD